MKSLLADISFPFALVFLVLAALFLFVARQQDANVRALTGNSGMAAALLTDKTSFTGSGLHHQAGFGDKGPTTYTVHYEFVHPDTGQTYQSRASVEHGVWEGMQTGTYYQILFSHENPTLTSLFSGQDFVDGAALAYQLAWACGALCLASFALGLWLRP